MTNEELAVKVQQGQKEYIPVLYNQVEKYLAARARRFCGKYPAICARCGVTVDDLIQEGYFAMMDTVNYYKPESGYKFITYIDFPLRNRYNKLTGHRPNQAKYEPLNSGKSLDEPLGTEDGTFSLGDVLKDKNARVPFEKIESSDLDSIIIKTVRNGVDNLPENQQRVIGLLFYRGLDAVQAARVLSITAGQVRQLKAAALKRLAHNRDLKELSEKLYPVRCQVFF